MIRLTSIIITVEENELNWGLTSTEQEHQYKMGRHCGTTIQKHTRSSTIFTTTKRRLLTNSATKEDLLKLEKLVQT